MPSYLPRATDYCKWLNLHDREFLKLRLSGIGYYAANEIMKEKYNAEVQANSGDDSSINSTTECSDTSS